MMSSQNHIPDSDTAGKQNTASRASASQQENKAPLPSAPQKKRSFSPTHPEASECSPSALQQYLLREFYTRLHNLENNQTSSKFRCGNSESEANKFLAEIHRSYETACHKGLGAAYLKEITKAIDQSLYRLLRRILVENHTWEQAKDLIRTLCSTGR